MVCIPDIAASEGFFNEKQYLLEKEIAKINVQLQFFKINLRQHQQIKASVYLNDMKIVILIAIYHGVTI